MTKPDTTPREPGLPPNRPFAAFIGRGLWLGLLTVLIIAFLAWLIIEWMS
jgi:hypothetical protein